MNSDCGYHDACINGVIWVVHDHPELANERSQFSHTTPLGYALGSGNWDVAQLLLEQGADPNARCVETLADDLTEAWNSPLHLACYAGHEEIAKSLLDHGADINAQNANGNTPLHQAASYDGVSGSLEICRLLVQRGADVNIRNNRGWTPLHTAVLYEAKEIQELLRKNGGEE